jgi:hypothetical protein
MSESIQVLSTQADYEQLRDLILSKGLTFVPMIIDRPLDDRLQDGKFCFLSSKPIDELNPYGHPPVKLADAKDPLILFHRPHHTGSYLTAGALILNTDNPEVVAQMRSTFQSLRRWLRKNWAREEQYSAYAGPEAHSLLASGDAQYRNLLSGVPIQTVVVKHRK